MHRRCAMFSALILLCCFFTQALAQQTDLDALNSRADKIFRAYDTVGGALVVMKDGEVVYERYYGWARKKDKQPVTKDTYFRVASVTKMVTGIGALRLVADKQLALDGDVGEVLDLPIRNPKYPDTPITLRMLMTHTSGLLDGSPFKNQQNSLADVFAKNRIKRVFCEKAPGASYSYANYGAGLVGAMIEKASGLSINQYTKETIFDPLGIDAAYSPALLKHPENIVNQHDQDGRVERRAEKVLLEAYDDTSDPLMHFRYTAGGLWITAGDMAKLLAMLNGGGTLLGVQILPPASVALMTQDQVGQNGIQTKTPYALFCERFTTLKEGAVIYGHQGQSLGMVSEAFFDPETGFSMALLTNGCSRAIDRRVCKIGRSMFNLLYPVFSSDSPEAYGL